VKPTQTELELRRHLASARLDPDHLQPWPAWKVFKDFLHREVDAVYDAASFQYDPSDSEDATEVPAMFWVRQFTERDPDTNEDELVGSLTVEFLYPPGTVPPHEDAEVWTLDFPDLEQWSSTVEGTAQFQDAVSREPTSTRVYYEEA